MKTCIQTIDTILNFPIYLSSPAADVYTPAASETVDLSYGVPAAPAISLADYNLGEISDKGYPNSGPSSYGRR